MLLCGKGSFGDRKQQALLAGVEYLEVPDTSSSEADLKGEQAKRQMPAPHQMTMPLMVVVSGGRYLALAWEPSPLVAPYFDVPDRRFKSGGQVMALLLPGNTGETERPAGGVLPYAAQRVGANTSLVVRATLFAGKGESAVDAVRAYLSFKGLPPLSATYPMASVGKLLATGWLSSGVAVSGRYRHAYPGDFSPQPAADAALCLESLATLPGLPHRALRTAAQAAIRAVTPSERGVSGIGHVRTFAAPLVYGGVWESLDRIRQGAVDTLKRVRPDGTIKYEKVAERPDFSATHFADHANGMAGEAIARVLEAAALTGDRQLRENGLHALAAVEKTYRNTVPRGAQTWEVPLHTPDILASAHLLRAFTLGYDLSGEKKWLEAARYWAWTGIPFVYLSDPFRSAANPPSAKERVGLYGTTPVLGATHWVAPNWIGLPVQWCGLVYADALLDLAARDAPGIWRKVAEGIVLSGIQQTWPVGSDPARQGLLPDSFTLMAQMRNDVAINPATLQVPYLRTIGRPLYERRVVVPGGPLVHAPGSIGIVVKTASAFQCTVTGWPNGEYKSLISGLQRSPGRVTIGGKSVPFEYRPEGGLLLLTLRGKAVVTVE
jgi:hypothetical protein